MNKKDLIDIRYGTPQDFDFIEATWKQALYNGNRFFGWIKKPIYYENYGNIIRRILSRPDLKISIACLKDEPTLCLAYCISQEKILHWVYTKKDWRRIVLMNDLVPPKVSVITHLTDRAFPSAIEQLNITGKQLWKKKWPSAIFDPFA